jgi:hypothetical protein
MPAATFKAISIGIGARGNFSTLRRVAMAQIVMVLLRALR